MGFLAILNWALANTPGFMRPAVGWLLDLLRKVTSLISSRWNLLGASVGRFWQAVSTFRTAVTGFAGQVWGIAVWIVKVLIPRSLAILRDAILRAVDRALNAAVAALNTVIATLRRWTQAAVSVLRGLVADLRSWALARLNALTVRVGDLLRALRHVLGGPAALADWLVGEMWSALGRYAYRQRDRFAHWLLDGSPVFTTWLASQVEAILVRWLS